MKPRVLLAAESFTPGRGGISQVARLLGLVLAGEAAAGRLDASLVALSDGRAEDLAGLRTAPSGGSRARFVARVWREAARSTHCLYDFLGMARAHCPVPGLRRPYMVGLMGIEIWEGSRRDRLRAARRADRLWAISDYTRTRAHAAFGGFGDVPVCWLATEDGRVGSERELPPGPPVATIVGRVVGEERYKGHRELIDVWPGVAANVPGARLSIVGGGPALPAVRSYAAASPAAASIDVRGYVPEEEMPAVWEETSLLAMPSRGEGFGLVYIEAMQRGIPVLASVHDAGAEVNAHGVTGLNADLDRPGDLETSLVALLGDPALRARMGRAARERWRRHFSFDSFRERFLSVLNEFLSLGSATGPGGRAC